jgi:branched-chain amino acid aminotransferase
MLSKRIAGKLFMLTAKQLVTPPISDGCLNGIMRKQLLAIGEKIEGIEVVGRIDFTVRSAESR